MTYIDKIAYSLLVLFLRLYELEPLPEESWEYWEYALSHPITKWEVPTKILYGGNDNLIDRDVVEHFAHEFQCGLDVMENGEHWFHTEEQLKVMRKWLITNLKNKELSKNERQILLRDYFKSEEMQNE